MESQQEYARYVVKGKKRAREIELIHSEHQDCLETQSWPTKRLYLPENFTKLSTGLIYYQQNQHIDHFALKQSSHSNN